MNLKNSSAMLLVFLMGLLGLGFTLDLSVVQEIILTNYGYFVSCRIVS
jgi:hypothetical protein